MNRIKMKMNKNLLIVLTFLLFNIGYGQQLKTWTGQTSTAWDEETNWSPIGKPTSSENVLVTNVTNQPVISTTGASCATLELLNSSPGSNVVLTVKSGNFSPASVIMNSNGGDTSDCSLIIETGRVSVSGNITMNGNALQNDVTFSGEGNLLIGGLMTGGILNSVGKGTVSYNGTGTRAVGAYNYNNLTLSGSGIRTINTLQVIVNGTLTLAGSAKASAAPTYGVNAALQYDSASSLTVGPEWVSPFIARGGVGISTANGESTVTISGAEKKFNDGVPLIIDEEASLLSDSDIYFGGDFINNRGSLTTDGYVYLAGNINQSIDSFISAKGVVMNKNAGTATFTGNINTKELKIDGAGTLNLGSGWTHTFTDWIRTQGTLNEGTSLFKISGNVIGTGGIFIAGTGTVEFNGQAQNLGTGLITYNNLVLSGTGIKTFGAKTVINDTFSILDGVVADLTTNLMHTAKSIKLGTTAGSGGSWGSSVSNAVNKNNIFFASNNGIVNVGPTIVIGTENLAAFSTTYGTPSATKSFTISGTDMLAGILVTAPVGFEVSTDGVTFTNTISIGNTGAIASSNVFVRLKATAPAGGYLGNIVLTSTGTANVNISIAESTVDKALLTITADNIFKMYGDVNPPLTFTYSGFKNGETESDLKTLPIVSTTAVTMSPVGYYDIDFSIAESDNYKIEYVLGLFEVRAYTNSGLIDLAISEGHLSPVFSETELNYATTVTNDITSVKLTPVSENLYEKVKINGVEVPSGTPSEDIPLQVGENTITTIVTAQDGTISTYTVVVTREPSSNAGLADLVLSEGDLSPAFTEGNKDYTATVPNDVASITIKPVDADATATITVNGVEVPSGTPSGEIPLEIGENTITTIVTAQDGTINTYTVIVTREPSSNAGLADLVLNEGTLSPAFTEGNKDYTATVPNDVASITIKPVDADATATITVNGVEVPSGTPSGEIPLQVGENTITTIVTAQDGTINTYTVVVTREPSSNAGLADLVLSEGTLSPAFTEGNKDYTATVSNDVTAITLTPVDADATATITVNGVVVPSGTASGEILLEIGENIITTVVTAQDGTISTYTVVVTREEAPAPDNAGLSDIVINDGSLSPAFNTDTNDYRVEVPNEINSIVINPITIDPTATVEMIVNGITINDNTAPIDLNVGENVITVIVTAEDGTQETYTIIVNRADAVPQTIIPTNIITPNGDGKNDFWIISGIDSYPNNSVKVFDRAARIVYSKNNYNNDWDGSYNGAPLTQDTYYYLIDLGNGQSKIKGFITIIRD
ncbi:cadherin-like beta sandwich domain-containing protein [[Flexibacter] sp. ATCC 35103]|uniref:cadherin-like beta sandwich domain-containing protein n=1 Tax=[Flexibacter] sp. ATCC 35103 TaxID=1937528 RepID=UPI0013F5B29F|nr:cadherin-like beta sandwich domain-containing protein [[Flexibacter] sp. ATCC 35103]